MLGVVVCGRVRVALSRASPSERINAFPNSEGAFNFDWW